MVEELKPHVLKREISVKADLVQIAFRKLREVCRLTPSCIPCATPSAWQQQTESLVRACAPSNAAPDHSARHDT